jgi:hypothetical protein
MKISTLPAIGSKAEPLISFLISLYGWFGGQLQELDDG